MFHNEFYPIKKMKNWRINLVFLIIILFGAVLIGCLFYIQIIKGDYYKALAYGQQKNFQIVKGERGKIFFRKGEVLATNVKGNYLSVCPDKIKEKEKTAEILSEILNIDKELILTKLKKESLFEKIKTNLTEEEKDKIKKSGLVGVDIKETFFRKYPQGLMASHIVGFLGGEDKGQYGIEGFYDNVLQGKEKIQNTFDTFLDNIDGADIFLTVDYNIQFKTEELLEKAKKELDIDSGQIIVMNPISGEILALAIFPRFDPNNYSKIEDLDLFQNNAISKIFEPGSIFKPITMAVGLEKEKITPETSYVDEGSVVINGYPIKNYNNKTWGKRTMTEVLEYSINTGAIFVEKQIGHQTFLEYIDKFGFFNPTGIDLQGEIFLGNKDLKKGSDINFATASFGQGIGITPIQMVRAFSAIANGGRLVKPFMVKKIVDKDKSIQEIQPQLSDEPIISQKTASQLTAMLISVVEHGFGKNAKIPGYYIAGKTGTAQVPWKSLNINKKGYSSKTWQSFISFFPAFNPQFLVLVKLDDPKNKVTAAVPVFRELAEYIINYYAIPPDYESF